MPEVAPRTLFSASLTCSLTYCMHIQHHVSMQSRASLTIVALSLAAVASNALWATFAYKQQAALSNSRQTTQDAIALLDQAIAALPVAARAGASEADVVRAAQRPGAANAPYEKAGYLWVDGLGLRFNLQGRLTGASALIENSEQALWAANPTRPVFALGQLASADN